VIAAAERAFRVARRVSRRATLRPFRPHGLILLYHRVAAPPWDPWHNCVAPQRFEQQLAYLTRVAEVVPLRQLQERLRTRGAGRPVVAITFDDGYADNLHAALPLLEKYSMPATVFIASAWIDAGRQFWWDRLSAQILGLDRVPRSLNLSLGSRNFDWKLETADTDGHAARNQVHEALWSALLMATDEEREQVFEQLAALAGRAAVADADTRPMTAAELRRLAASPLIEIGAHTMTHCSLPDLPPTVQLAEIAGSREQCRDLLGEYPSSFAYPFGGFDDGTPGLVGAAGFDRACSSQNDLMWEGGDSQLLPRIQVRDYAARTFALRFAWEWLP
jgi:peptidoglycan/xylan/chitin deacetylase (PgdA/CDA1 family)